MSLSLFWTTHCASPPRGNLRGGLATLAILMSARLTVNDVIISRDTGVFEERKHTLNGVSSCRATLVKFAHLVGRAVWSAIGRRQRAIDHVALGPLCPHASRLDDNDLDVPFSRELFLEGLAESFECCNTQSDGRPFCRHMAAGTYRTCLRSSMQVWGFR